MLVRSARKFSASSSWLDTQPSVKQIRCFDLDHVFAGVREPLGRAGICQHRKSERQRLRVLRSCRGVLLALVTFLYASLGWAEGGQLLTQRAFLSQAALHYHTTETVREPRAGNHGQLELAQAPPRSVEGAPPRRKVRINSASANELQLLVGIGPRKAEAILMYRHINGPFRSLDEITLVEGLGPAFLRVNREYILLD